MRCVIVTGVSRGLGAALARVLLGREAVVLGVGRSSAADLQGERYRFVQCDLADVPGIDAALAPAFGALAGLAPRSVCLVNNAATVEPVGLVEMHDGAGIARSLAVNLAAPVALSALFLRAFADKAVERRIVNVSSGAARSAIAGESLYCAAKAGLEMLTKVLAAEVRHATFRAVSLRPGVIDTDMQTVMRAQDERSLPGVAMFRGFKSGGRLATPEDAALRIADRIVLGDVKHGATYSWPDLDRPLPESQA